jgi:hypothetical protein
MQPLRLPGGAGLHHMALYSDDCEADIAFYRKAGVEIAFSGLMMGARVTFLDTVKQLGFMTELFPVCAMADAQFAKFRAAAENWDGKDPIRPGLA